MSYAKIDPNGLLMESYLFKVGKDIEEEIAREKIRVRARSLKAEHVPPGLSGKELKDWRKAKRAAARKPVLLVVSDTPTENLKLDADFVESDEETVSVEVRA